jgi:hypothetical protein
VLRDHLFGGYLNAHIQTYQDLTGSGFKALPHASRAQDLIIGLLLIAKVVRQTVESGDNNLVRGR